MHKEGYNVGDRPPGLQEDGSFDSCSQPGTRVQCFVDENGNILSVDKTTGVLAVDKETSGCQDA